MLRFCCTIILLSLYNSNFAQTSLNDSTKTGGYSYVNPNKIKVDGYFKNTQRHKLWTWSNQENELLKQTKYKHGKQLWVIYFEKSKPWLKINRHGKKRIIRPCDCRVVDYN